MSQIFVFESHDGSLFGYVVDLLAKMEHKAFDYQLDLSLWWDRQANGGADIDPEWESPDTGKPVYMVVMPDNYCILVDGNHRAFQARKAGKTHIAAKVFPYAVAELARITTREASDIHRGRGVTTVHTLMGTFAVVA